MKGSLAPIRTHWVRRTFPCHAIHAEGADSRVGSAEGARSVIPIQTRLSHGVLQPRHATSSCSSRIGRFCPGLPPSRSPRQADAIGSARPQSPEADAGSESFRPRAAPSPGKPGDSSGGRTIRKVSSARRMARQRMNPSHQLSPGNREDGTDNLTGKYTGSGMPMVEPIRNELHAQGGIGSAGSKDFHATWLDAALKCVPGPHRGSHCRGRLDEPARTGSNASGSQPQGARQEELSLVPCGAPHCQRRFPQNSPAGGAEDVLRWPTIESR